MPVSPTILLCSVFVYIFLLFSLARWGDKQSFVKASWVKHPIVYALALGVYCTSWTFYGLVGTASVKGWNFFPILLGPILLFTIGFPLLERIYKVCRQEHIHSIADFIASRYGKRQGVAATVSLVVLMATIPYIALQLKAVSDTLLLTMGDDFLVSQDLTFVIALSMVMFTLLFGAKRLDMSGYHSGLMTAIAFESIVKLVVLSVVAVACFVWMSDSGWTDVLASTYQYNYKDASQFMSQEAQSSLLTETSPSVFYQPIMWPRFIVETILSICAILCLPRMFHVTFVECLSKTHLKYSRWVFVFYLFLISVCIVVIASTGNLLLGNNPAIDGDAYVIALPLSQDTPWVAILAFLGGFSAATAMIIVATMTLSHMLSNDVILPLLLRGQKHKNTRQDFSRRLIFARRSTVIFVIVAAYLYQVVLAENIALTSIGLIAFALVVQLAPAILFGLFWRKGNVTGLYAGLLVGLALWFYTLMIPLLTDAGLMSTYIVDQGLFNVRWLRPEMFLGLTFSDSFTRAVLISLSANILFYWWYSVTSVEKLVDRIQATAFTQLTKGAYDYYNDIHLGDLRVLLNEFLGESAAFTLFASYNHSSSTLSEKKQTEKARKETVRKETAQKETVQKIPQGLSKHQLVEKSQKALASIVGVASAQSMIESLYSGKKMAVEDVVNLFGETTKALRFNQEVLSSSFDNISSGISVIDKDLRLIAWNQCYEDMFEYPAGMLYVGVPVIDIMQFNGERGFLGDGNVDALIRKRLSYMTTGKDYRFIRFHKKDVVKGIVKDIVIEIKGRPLPNGGYVTTYDDITEFIQVQQRLEEANATLEQRVLDRTRVIEEVNVRLREAKKFADEASASKTKFLALASHDIMQPLNAASLYASTLMDDATISSRSDKETVIIHKLKIAIENTESIIATLLEMSKIDNGVIQPNCSIVDLNKMLSNIVDEASIQHTKRLRIRYCKTSLNVYSDQHYLYRIVQNFVSNAIKYTPSGKVLIGCRRGVDEHGVPYVDICIFDTGVGISQKEQEAIFSDFYRVPKSNVSNTNSVKKIEESISGVGLGLSVVTRFSELLQHKITCHSVLNKGSCFSVRVPVATKKIVDSATPHTSRLHYLDDLCIIYVDDQTANLSATASLLERWQCQVIVLASVEEARDYVMKSIRGECVIPDVLLMDYQLGLADVSGITLAEEMLEQWHQYLENDSTKTVFREVPVCIVSAAVDSELPEKVSQAGFEFLRKPLKPGRLRALLTQLKERRDINQG
jgi:Na+/proline symporter/signal transduction histidine kinase